MNIHGKKTYVIAAGIAALGAWGVWPEGGVQDWGAFAASLQEWLTGAGGLAGIAAGLRHAIAKHGELFEAILEIGSEELEKEDAK